MSGKKDKVVTFIGAGLTDAQASDLIGEFAKAKNRVAPKCRATAAKTTSDKLSSLLGNTMKQIGKK